MIRLREVKILITQDYREQWLHKCAQILHCQPQDITDLTILKKSLDARQKGQIFFIYEFALAVKDEKKILKKDGNANIKEYQPEVYEAPPKGLSPLKTPIIIVGSGPAGLFAAYLLAENGYHPIVIERGKPMPERIRDVENFWQTNQLNPESNVQFGEGGAGTFSDGKLNTMIKDKRHLGQKVFDIFIENGAPEEIKYLNRPHIGTDKLRAIIPRIREKIIAMGGEFRYNTKLTNLFIEDEKLQAIEVNNTEKIPCENLLLAIGHSARDTFRMLANHNIEMTSKPFAVGIRIMHPQEVINQNQYGQYAKVLGAANYKLTYQTQKGRGVYSFCMCPGGYIVNASSETGKLAINGMSNYQQDSNYANSAIVVTVNPQDYGDELFAGVNWQEELERRAYQVGNGSIPVETWKCFRNNEKLSNDLSLTAIKGSYTWTDIKEILPPFISDALLEAIPEFAKKIHGFADDETVLAAIESRTSSPIRILRDEFHETNISGIYPMGEGAGYAGGITSAAIDGLLTAECIIKKYH